MVLLVDARLPVIFTTPDPTGPETALLIQDNAPAPAGHPVARFTLPATAHPTGCACCLPRGPVAEALSYLFLARARGEISFFRQVLALPANAAGTAAIHAALTQDPVVSARFRLG